MTQAFKRGLIFLAERAEGRIMSAYARFLAHGKDLKMLFQVSPVPSRAKFKPLLLFSTARLLNQSSPYRFF